jgi:hypothetical protein
MTAGRSFFSWSAPRMSTAASSGPRTRAVSTGDSIFGDQIIDTASPDRLLHHSTTINIRGESYRLKDRRRAGLLPRTEDQQASSEPAAAVTVALNNRGKRTRAL